MAAIDDVASAANKLFIANAEKGANLQKKANLQSALTLLTSAIDAGTLTTAQKNLAVEAQKNTKFAIEMEENAMNGSIGLALNEKRGAEYLHVETAYTKALAALSA